MKTSTKRILSILFSAFFLLAAITVYGSLISPEMDAAAKLQAAVASKSQVLSNQNAAVTQVSGLINQFRSATNLQQSLGLAVPIGPNITQALNQWQAIAGASQANLQSLNIQPSQPVNPKAQKASAQTLVKKLNSIPTEVTIFGGYGSLKQFLNLIETNARVTNVTDFDFKSLTGSQSALSSGNYSLQLNVVAYYQEN